MVHIVAVMGILALLGYDNRNDCTPDSMIVTLTLIMAMTIVMATIAVVASAAIPNAALVAISILDLIITMIFVLAQASTRIMASNVAMTTEPRSRTL